MSSLSSTVDSVLSRSYLEPLLTGDRTACRKVIDNAIARGISAYDLLTQLVWPTVTVSR
jgi:methanogenic corrinoid protein MtbC1